MTNAENLLARAEKLGATLLLKKGNTIRLNAPSHFPENLLQELRKNKPEMLTLLKSKQLNRNSQSPAPGTPMGCEALQTDAKELIIGGCAKRVGRTTERLQLVLTKEGAVAAPVELFPWLTITDTAKFVDATLMDLASYVAAVNLDTTHWSKDLVDEKLEHLERCGVKAEIREVQ